MRYFFKMHVQSQKFSVKVFQEEQLYYNFRIYQEVLSPIIDSTCVNLCRYAKFGNEQFPVTFRFSQTIERRKNSSGFL